MDLLKKLKIFLRIENTITEDEEQFVIIHQE